jgi:hydroxyacylglutathione hydrolase
MRLTDKIHLLKHDFDIMLGPDNRIPRFVNSLVIFGNEITLVDTGVQKSIENIIPYIKQNGRDPSEISTLILSHSHPDHIGSAHKLKKLTGCKVLAHKAEKDWMEDIELQQKQRPVPGFISLVDEPVIIDDFLEHDQILKLDADLTVRIIHSPGHSRGSLNLEFLEDKILFTADSIPVMNDIPNYENYVDLNKSLKSIKDNRNNEIVISSWTSPIYEKEKLTHLLADAATYLKQLDDCIHKIYTGHENSPLEFCKQVIEELTLPEFYVNPIVDSAFRTHLK